MELPPWAADAQDFVAKMAEALESPYVSRTLHRWIDLIFGCRNQGQAALLADNVFHHLTYDHMCACPPVSWLQGASGPAAEAICIAQRTLLRSCGEVPTCH